ncbi:MAG: bifunctional 5,10-methylenetetrahydrofolate dehydrogenase/5,10-methenyltetrahydrofolate cyclohydrolase [Patescibacteria group bacterium]|jgi:methylenetetrahydrofolate dehydrogenase (NADP+)/methenyltetrahydrofolate cyclohydrolase
MTELLNGRILAKAIRDKAKVRVEALSTPPGLAVILVGEDPASHLYVGLKENAAKEVGIYVERIEMPAETTTETIIETIKKLNKRKEIHGILVQLPLPGTQDTDAIIATIDPIKDVDGFHPESLNLLLASTPRLVPPTALAVMRLLQATHLPLNKKSAVIVGNSEIFARPIIELLRDAGVTATFVHKETEALPAITRAADILITAIGAAHMITPDMTKPSGVFIDVGTAKTAEGKTTGDGAPELIGHSGFLSPVPGGVGPLTVAYLLLNVIKAKELQEREA